MKKTVSIILILSTLLGIFVCFTSCSQYMSDEEARAILEEKLPTSYYVMSAVYGDMLKVQEAEKIDKTWTTPHYFKVMEDSHYTTIAAIKADAEKVFAPMYLETVYEYAFDGSEESMSRFAEDKGLLTVDVVKEPYQILTDLYIETATVISSSRYAAEIKIEGSANGGDTRKFVYITLACIDGEWLFNGPTY